MTIIGEIAGLLTSLFFAINAVVVTKAGQKVGSSWIINRTRVVFALLYLVILNFILYHQPLPLQAGTQHWTWLSLSGVIGLALGDAFLFQAYLMVGARLGTLLLSLSTIFGALEAWIFFGESLSLMEIVGITLTLGGIIWVILEQGNNKTQTHPPIRIGDFLRSPRRNRSSHRISLFQTRHDGQFLTDQRKCDSHVGGSHRIMVDHFHATRSWKDNSNSQRKSKCASIAGARCVDRTRDRSFIIIAGGSKHSRRHSQRADISLADLHASHQPFLFQRTSGLASRRWDHFGNDRCRDSLFGLEQFKFFQFQEV